MSVFADKARDLGTVNSNYLHEVLHPQITKELIKSFAKLIKSSKVKFDAIAFSGMSGALVAPLLSLKLGKPLLLVRKDNDGSHGYEMEGLAFPTLGERKHVIIIDDLICSGATIKRMLDRLIRKGIDCNGIFLYKGSDSCSKKIDNGFDHNGKTYKVICLEPDTEKK